MVNEYYQILAKKKVGDMGPFSTTHFFFLSVKKI